MKNRKIIIKVSAPEDQIGYWLRCVSNNVAYSFRKKLEMCNVTVAEWIILRQMYEIGETSPGIVAVNTGLTKGAISKLVSRLLKKGLVVRDASGKDRRFQEIKLTAKGKVLVPKIAQIADKNDQHFFGDLSQGEKDSLLKLLKNMVKIHRLGKGLAVEVGK